MLATHCDRRLPDARDDLVWGLSWRGFVASDAAIDQRHHADRMCDDARIVRGKDERHAMSFAEITHHVHEDFRILAVEIRRRFVSHTSAGRAAIARATATRCC